MTDPYEAPSALPRASPNRGPGVRAWVLFVLQRTLVLVGPSLWALLVLSPGERWLALVAAALPLAFSLPTTVWRLRTRFFATQIDERPIVVQMGEWMDRHHFRSYCRAVAADRIAFGAWMLLTLALAAAQRGDLVLLALLVVLTPVVAWAMAAAISAVLYGDAIVALVSDRPEEALAALDRLLWGPRRFYPLAEPALLLRARTHLALGHLEKAEADLAAIGGWRIRLQADLTRAQIALGRGDPTPAEALLARPPPTLGLRLDFETTKGLLLAHGRDPVALSAWPDRRLMDHVPGYVHEVWAALRAVALHRRGQTAEAREALPHDLSAFVHGYPVVYPDVWRLMVEITDPSKE